LFVIVHWTLLVLYAGTVSWATKSQHIAVLTRRALCPCVLPNLFFQGHLTWQDRSILEPNASPLFAFFELTNSHSLAGIYPML